MSILKKLNPLYWLNIAKERFVKVRATKAIGSVVRTWIAALGGLLSGWGILSPEQAESLTGALDPLVEGLLLIGITQLWSLFEKSDD
jgi:hypothetical protein